MRSFSYSDHLVLICHLSQKNEAFFVAVLSFFLIFLEMYKDYMIAKDHRNWHERIENA